MEIPHLLDVSLRQDDTVLITISGDLTSENLPLLKEDIEKASAFISHESKRALRPLSALVDLSTLHTTYAPEAMLLLADFEKQNRPYIEKTACFGANFKLKFAGEIISALSNRENISFFDTKDEAIAALKGA